MGRDINQEMGSRGVILPGVRITRGWGVLTRWGFVGIITFQKPALRFLRCEDEAIQRLWNLFDRSGVVFKMNASELLPDRFWRGTARELADLLACEASALSQDEKARAIPSVSGLGQLLAKAQRQWGPTAALLTRGSYARIWTIRPREVATS